MEEGFMCKFILLCLIIFQSFFISFSAEKVYVRGYYRSDGTYVKPHYRSAPNNDKSDNFGPSRTDSERLNPYTRDNDNDGIPNYLDKDDDNDGVLDNYDKYQYNKKRN